MSAREAHRLRRMADLAERSAAVRGRRNWTQLTDQWVMQNADGTANIWTYGVGQGWILHIPCKLQTANGETLKAGKRYLARYNGLSGAVPIYTPYAFDCSGCCQGGCCCNGSGTSAPYGGGLPPYICYLVTASTNPCFPVGSMGPVPGPLLSLSTASSCPTVNLAFNGGSCVLSVTGAVALTATLITTSCAPFLTGPIALGSLGVTVQLMSCGGGDGSTLVGCCPQPVPNTLYMTVRGILIPMHYSACKAYFLSQAGNWGCVGPLWWGRLDPMLIPTGFDAFPNTQTWVAVDGCFESLLEVLSWCPDRQNLPPPLRCGDRNGNPPPNNWLVTGRGTDGQYTVYDCSPYCAIGQIFDKDGILNGDSPNTFIDFVISDSPYGTVGCKDNGSGFNTSVSFTISGVGGAGILGGQTCASCNSTIVLNPVASKSWLWQGTASNGFVWQLSDNPDPNGNPTVWSLSVPGLFGASPSYTAPYAGAVFPLTLTLVAGSGSTCTGWPATITVTQP